MKFVKWLGFLFIVISTNAMAEGACPPGQYPIGGQGAVGCAPIPGYPQAIPADPARPLGKWVKTWGAVAMGAVGLQRNYGVSTGKLTKEEAERDAMARCSKHGATNCQIGLAYFNQCVAVGEPQIDGKPNLLGTVTFNGAETVKRATALAQSACEKGNPDNPCKVIYENCTKQIFENF